jgi:ABC-2 type transport system permease protein
MKILKYWQIAKISWSNGLVYRLNFVMWRVRVVVQLLTAYFLWLAVFSRNQLAFGYDRTQILTYILIGSIIRTLVLSQRSIDAQVEIASGDLSNYLVKPINYFRYWLARDGADKLLNLIFGLGELALVILLLRPAIAGPAGGMNLVGFLGLVTGAMMMYFYLSMMISLTTFWYPEQNGWPQRFLTMMILEFLAGGLFPLDILPEPVFRVVRFLPTSYLIFMPMQVYLGRLTGQELGLNLVVIAVWLVIFKQAAKMVFKRGLRSYEAYGR